MNHIENLVTPVGRMLTRATFSRRGLLATTALGALLVGNTHAREATPAQQGSPSSASRLLVGVSGGPFDDLLYPQVKFFDSSFSDLGSVNIADGIMDAYPTGDPNLMLVTSLGAAGLLDIEANEVVEIDWGDTQWESWMSQWALGTLSGGNGEVRNPEWVVSSSIEGGSVVSINLVTREGRDITEFINQSGQEFVPVVPTYMPSGSLAGLWTGDNVYLVDLETPEDARRLVGDDPDLFSTTFDIDPTGTWCSYTTYDPGSDTAAGSVYIENVETAEYHKVTDGTAWSQVKFVPGDPGSFLLVSDGEVQLRSIDGPQAATEQLATIGIQTHHQSTWDASGTRLVQGTRADNDAPAQWVLIDTESREATELPELEGLSPLMVPAAQPAPKHMVFGRVSEEPGPVLGLDFDTGEVIEYLPEANLGSVTNHSSSADGRWYFLITENRGDSRGAWIIDNQEHQMHEMPWGDGLYTLSGAISPDGTVAAITTIERPSDDVATYAIDLLNPDDIQMLTEGHVLGWS